MQSTLREWRCPHCRRLFCRCYLSPGSVVEKRCDHCKVVVVITAPQPESTRLLESIQAATTYRIATRL